MKSEINDPEKYISIEYKDWINKYKPLEEENKRLKTELAQTKVRVKVVANTWRMGEFWEGEIGYLSTETEKNWKVDINNWDEVVRAIEFDFVNTMRSNSRWLTHDKVVELINEKKEVEKIIEEKINRIPKFIKWLFKIKNK